ncbi:cyanate hydratase isoform X2 [Raphanus sativus]|uniref:Cyanate hydratase isoform X2 n=1 Tax=Raphanus sativus TaxID=3726 RepID=A0A9W3DRB8_RAPSA|nr:cyanate hydratase isoform X2 [Raphanus sativus]
MEAAATKQSVTNRLLTVKSASGKTYSQLAEETGLTNVYVAQLLRRQAQLKPDTVPKLREALPALTDELIAAMVSPPWRSYDPNLIQEPTVYSMSAIDFYCSVDKVKGVDGNNRVVVTLDGKYLSHSEQRTENMVSRLNLKGSTSE